MREMTAVCVTVRILENNKSSFRIQDRLKVKSYILRTGKIVSRLFMHLKDFWNVKLTEHFTLDCQVCQFSQTHPLLPSLRIGRH